MTGLRWLGLITLLGGCSTLAEQPNPKQCQTQADCAETEACRNGRCEDASKSPPLAQLGFAIREFDQNTETFRVEIRGCDQEVGDVDQSREIEIVRRNVTQTFELQVHASDDVDFDDPQPEELETATLAFSQQSRLFFRRPIRRDNVTHPTTISDTTIVVDSAKVEWPRYDPRDASLPPRHIVWETRVITAGESGPPVVRMIRPSDTLPGSEPCTTDDQCCTGLNCDDSPNFCLREGDAPQGECTAIGNPSFGWAFRYERQCDRIVTGEVEIVGADGSFSATEGTVRLQHADLPSQRLAVAAANPREVMACTLDEVEASEVDPCGSADLFCDAARGECVLALAGRDAAFGSPPIDPAGEFSAAVYTYCEAIPTAAITRAYAVQVSATGPYPTVNYVVERSVYPWVGGESVSTPLGKFCVPDWGPAVEVAVALGGAPTQLVAGGADSTRCCDVGCLPPNVDAVDRTGGGASTCTGVTTAGSPTVRFETPFSLSDDERALWQDQDCNLPVEDAAGRLRASSTQMTSTCPGNAPCVIRMLAAGTTEAPRVYAVRIESPVGSVLASGDLTIALDESGTPVDVEPVDGAVPIELVPRVLVRGTVKVGAEVCERRPDPNDDCRSRGAVVIAERIAALGETTANTPGPYLHQVNTFYDPVAARDGAFVLPLDRGLWVLTALPAPGQDGGPARFFVLDLRDDKEPSAIDFVLEEGILVTLNLRSFDRRTQVTPLDIGSFGTLVNPVDGLSLDLNNPATCLRGDGEIEGCRIRELIPQGSTLTVSQVGLARFTARAPATPAAGTCQ